MLGVNSTSDLFESLANDSESNKSEIKTTNDDGNGQDQSGADLRLMPCHD